MNKKPPGLMFYVIAIPISVFAGIGYADSFKYYGMCFDRLTTNKNYPSISYDGMVMKSIKKDNQQ